MENQSLSDLISSIGNLLNTSTPIVPIVPVAPMVPAVPMVPMMTKPPAPFEFDMHHTTQQIVKRLKKFGEIIKENPDSYELESRLIVKHSNSHKMSPHVPEALFNQILHFYTRNVKYFEFMPWYYTSDSFFNNDIRVRNSWSSKNKKPVVAWVKKKLIENSDWHIDGRPLSMRISLKIEKKVPALETLPVPILLQTKQTCSFKDRAVTIYFSSIWQGESEYQMKVAIPTHSIEVEINNSSILHTTDAEEIITNLVIRTLELQGLNSPLSLAEVGTCG
jgi:hypothetical protein